MKNYWKIILNTFVLGFLLTSCSDFLDENPQTSLSTEQVFANLDNIQPYLDGVYNKWRDTRVNRKGFFMLLGSDEVQQGDYQSTTDAVQGGLDYYNGFYEPNNTFIAEAWNIRWPAVILSTEALYYLKDIEERVGSEDSLRVQSFIGQASFYRASVLLELVQCWGEVPLAEIVNDRVQVSGRKSLETIYDVIESDLLKASKALPEKSDASNVRIPTRWAAKGMLAKMYMAAHTESGYRSFSKAKEQLEEIKAQGGFRLVNNYAALWTAEDNVSSEIIFEFNFNNVWPDTNELQWYAGSRAVAGDPTCYMGGYDLAMPTSYCHADIVGGGIWETGDLRREESIRYNFVYKGKSPAAIAGFGDDQLFPHMKKFEDQRIDGEKSFYTSGKNIYVLRYSDILLMLAECLNEEGSTAEAVKIVNDEVRKRAWGGSLPDNYKWNAGMSKDEFREKIMEERMRELCFEGWRRFDLIRTGKFVEFISERNRWAKASGTIKEHHARFPIPLVEINQNPNLSNNDQNPGYNK